MLKFVAIAKIGPVTLPSTPKVYVKLSSSCINLNSIIEISYVFFEGWYCSLCIVKSKMVRYSIT